MTAGWVCLSIVGIILALAVLHRERDTHTPGTAALLVLGLMFIPPAGIIAAAIAATVRTARHRQTRAGAVVSPAGEVQEDNRPTVATSVGGNRYTEAPAPEPFHSEPTRLDLQESDLPPDGDGALR